MEQFIIGLPGICFICLMTIQCSIILAGYGSNEWRRLGERACESAIRQDADEILFHFESDGTLASTRNNAIAQASGKHIIICDLDDELERGYLQAMLEASGDIRYPLVRYVRPGPTTMKFYGKNGMVDLPVITGPPKPVHIPECNLFSGRNYVVIGAMMERERVLKVGGFRELPAYEDYDLLLRMTLDGAKFEFVPAIYRAYVNPAGRNSKIANPQELVQEILARYIDEAREKGLV